ncbi:uncharacterized protein LY79DRAFT_579304 [Colletotrichum navitas]|uniref:Uncharacterized protein n=1 Tax=Colletotrichum navitas TaxID=681940 RepID=A0AAD8Q0A3_9PEZI|nr:uncharacterized protein LY79DRAFT_579304 [Colletotrichum navitas]KAK1593476.1 hypothetical protein LY79DRAFT_579304 [Colletotrichum navitas]
MSPQDLGGCRRWISKEVMTIRALGHCMSSGKTLSGVLAKLVLGQAAKGPTPRSLCFVSGQAFRFYLKAHNDGYSVSNINNLPTGQSTFCIVAVLVVCRWADVTGKRWLSSILIRGLMDVVSIYMAAWNIFRSCFRVWRCPEPAMHVLYIRSHVQIC